MSSPPTGIGALRFLKTENAAAEFVHIKDVLTKLFLCTVEVLFFIV